MGAFKSLTGRLFEKCLSPRKIYRWLKSFMRYGITVSSYEIYLHIMFSITYDEFDNSYSFDAVQYIILLVSFLLAMYARLLVELLSSICVVDVTWRSLTYQSIWAAGKLVDVHSNCLLANSLIVCCSYGLIVGPVSGSTM